MPEYSSTPITPADSVKTPAMNGSTSGNYELSALKAYILASKGLANGLASLDANGKLPAAQLPDLADDVLVYANYATFPASGTAGKLYIAADTNKIYRWDDSLGTPAYVYLKVDWTDLTDGTVTVKKAECDASGNTITSTYETKADANDLKNAIDDLEDTKADKDGYYAGLTAGNAEQLLSSALIHDSAIYTDRTAGGGEDIGNKSYQKKIVGGTVVVNQQIKNGNFTNTANWWSNTGKAGISASNNTLVQTYNQKPNAAYDSGIIVSSNYISTVLNHRYMVKFDFRSTRACKVYSYSNNFTGGTTAQMTVSANTWVHYVGYALGKQNSSASNFLIYLFDATILEAGDVLEYRNVQLIDLNIAFPTSVVDYINTLSNANRTAFLSPFFKKFIPNTNPTLQSVCVASKENTGFNQFDYDTGKARILANIEYKIEGTYSSLAFADLNGNALSITPDSDGLFTSSVEAILTVTGGDDSSTCVFIHWDDSRDGEYEPFKKYSYPMDSDVVLRGIPLLDSDNNLYYDGDVLEADGTKKRWYTHTNLGEVTSWQYDGIYGSAQNVFSFYANSESWTSSQLAKAICSKYMVVTNNHLNATNEVCMSFVTSSGYTRVRVNDPSFTRQSGESGSAFVARFKTYLDGVYCDYKRATPAIETAEPFTEEQVCDNWGTEAFTDGLTRDVFVPPMAVADYTQNLRDKLEASPSTPDADGLYLMKRENGQNTYVAYTSPIPTESTDGTYVLKATVADGAMTLAWVAEGE